MSQRTENYILTVKQKATTLWNALNDLEMLQKEWTALDYGNTLPDGEGANLGITKAMVVAVVFDAANALRTTMNTGVATNVAKLL